jgi:membrane protein
VKLPWQKTDSSSAAEPVELAADAPAETQPTRKGYTPKKGRPTPKRADTERERGVRRSPAKPPETPKEARERRKALKESMSKEEYREFKRKEREQQTAQRRKVQEAMDRGEEKYLLARDRGDERRFVRDWVDSRRHMNNMIMPVALGLLVVMFIAQNYPQTSAVMSTFVMVVMLSFAVEGLIIGRGANKAVRNKFPTSTEPGISLGFYAYSRATQLRRLRSPKPRVNIGDKV